MGTNIVCHEEGGREGGREEVVPSAADPALSVLADVSIAE